MRENETNVFTSGDFSQYKDTGEARINEQYCEDIFKKIKDYEYGFVADGERFNDDSSFDWSKYRLSSPTEFEKNKIGICWDYCEYIADALDKKGIKYNLYFLNLITGEGKFTTHTFIVADIGDDKCVYIECAYKKYMMCETHYDMKDIFELSDVIAQRMLGDIDNHTKQEYDLYEYTTARPKIGSTSDEFMEYIWEHGKKICEHRHIEDTFKGRAYDEEREGSQLESEDCKYTGDMLTPRIIPSDCKHRSLVVQPNGPNIIYIPKHEVERLFNHEHREHHDRDILKDLCMRAKGCNPDELHVDIIAIIDNGKERYDDILSHAPIEKVKFIKACIDPNTYKLRKNLVLEWLSFQHDPLDVYEYTFDGTDIRTYCEMFNCGTANFFSDVHEFIEREQIDEQFVYITMEEKLSTEDRKEVKYWGLPSQKKYPLPDESHVRSALRFFKDCPEKDRPELARNIVKRAKQLNMDWTKWDQLKPYLSKTMQKQFKE